MSIEWLECIEWPAIFMPGISGITGEVDSPRASSHRFINLISDDWELLMRAPNDARFLLTVWDSISAVISTAWAWCMIMSCMKRASFGERGGRVALVVEGSVLVGWPGAPGCTTIGATGACCAQTGGENKPAIVLPAISAPRNAKTDITDRSILLLLG
jgi:hypothetical protein